MRKLFLSTAAAALLIAGAASAQNVSVQSGQVNRAAQNATVRIDAPFVGAVLTGNGAAIGNIYEVDGFNVTEVGSNNGGQGALQTNSGDQTSGLSSISTTGTSIDLSSTTAGNAVNLDGVEVRNTGSRRLNQLNESSVQSSGLTITNNRAGIFEGTSAALGNTVSANGSASVALGGGGAGGELLQTNNGRQIANLSVSNGNLGEATLIGQAAGNAVSAEAPSVNLGSGTTQTNTSFQSVTANVNGTSALTLNVSGAALGNTISAAGGSSSVGASQANSASQTSLVQVGASLAVGNLNASSATVGNAISFNNTGAVSMPGGSQTNYGVGSATLNLTNNTANQANGSAQSMGNLMSLGAGDNVAVGTPQFNHASQTASLTSNFGTVNGAASFNSLAGGNFLSVESTGMVEGINGNMRQNNFANQASFTTITGGSFGSLTAGASSLGNVTSVTNR